MKHTPGPWKINGHNIEDNNSTIAILLNRIDNNGSTNISILESKTNARLIASAPNLIDLVERSYLKLLSLGFWEGRTTEEGQRLLSDLRDIIAEVRGITDKEVQNEFEDKAITKAISQE